MNNGQAIRQGTAGAIYADLLPSWVYDRAKDFFSYGTEWLNIALSTTVTKQIAIQNDSDYLIVGANAELFNQGAITKPATQPIKFVITDTGSGRQLMNTPTMFANLVGTGQLPGIWPYPKLIARASVIQIDASNIDTANAYDLRFSFMGFKIFDQPEQGQ